MVIHRPQSIKEIIGRTKTMAKLYEAWNDMTRLYNKTLKIAKDDWGMDRYREMMLIQIKNHIPEMKIMLEKIIDLFKEDFEAII